MDYPRLLIEWRRINNLKEPGFIISRSRLKYIRYSNEWRRLHKEGFSLHSITLMYKVSRSSIKAVFKEVDYDYVNKRDRSSHYCAATIWRSHMEQGLTASQIAVIYSVKEQMVTRQMLRFIL